MVRAIERRMLRMRGVDPDELEEEIRSMDAARKERERARRAAIRRNTDDIAIDVLTDRHHE